MLTQLGGAGMLDRTAKDSGKGQTKQRKSIKKRFYKVNGIFVDFLFHFVLFWLFFSY